jgi:dihydroorotate dehydrogenase electron transfer subunit
MAIGPLTKLWGWHTLQSVRLLRIRDIVRETPNMRTIRFAETLDAIPGQFVMVWIPGIDEFPMSVSYSGPHFGITYQILGVGTKALAAMGIGEKVGIRGPYGRGFSLKGKKVLFVAGGAGMAPIAPLLDDAKKRRIAVDVVLGARTKEELLFEKRSKRAGAVVHISTDDGTKGFKGFATELAASMLAEERYDGLYACGPEKMAAKLLDLAVKSRLPMEASLERFMKCGIGICDSCALDGRHVCKDGPVFSKKELISFSDFGKTKLDPAGRKVPV